MTYSPLLHLIGDWFTATKPLEHDKSLAHLYNLTCTTSILTNLFHSMCEEWIPPRPIPTGQTHDVCIALLRQFICFPIISYILHVLPLNICILTNRLTWAQESIQHAPHYWSSIQIFFPSLPLPVVCLDDHRCCSWIKLDYCKGYDKHLHVIK